MPGWTQLYPVGYALGMRGIVNIIIGIVFIIGGLSGGMVMRGTNSGGALAIIGAFLVVLGIVRMAGKA